MPKPPSLLTAEEKKARNAEYQRKFRERHAGNMSSIIKRYRENGKMKKQAATSTV